MLLSFKTMVCNSATERKMLETERNSGIQKFEEISFGSLIIAEHQGLPTSHRLLPVVPTHTSVADGHGCAHRTYPAA